MSTELKPANGYFIDQATFDRLNAADDQMRELAKAMRAAGEEVGGWLLQAMCERNCSALFSVKQHPIHRVVVDNSHRYIQGGKQ